jgi:protein ImuB
LTLKLQSPQAEALACRWLNLWQLKLEALRLPAPVLALALSASQYCGRDTDSDDLYAGRRGQYTPLQLVGLLQAKLGSAQVCRPAQVAAYLPEMAGVSIPLQSAAPAGVKPPARPQPAQAPMPARNVAQSVAQTPATYKVGADHSPTDTFTGLSAPHRPAFLFAQPEPLQQQVQLQPGLERIQSQWWQGPSEARDYLTAQSADGRWLWIYRTEQQQWFVHGVFA